jgi:alanine racemase
MRAAQASIHVEAITRNLARVRELAPGAKVLAIVKADGYGHGLERVTRYLSGADAFGVASIEDAERIRALGMNHRIVLLSGFDEQRDLDIVRELKLDCVLHDHAQLGLLATEPDAANRDPIRFWLKFDTGMHRLGFAIADAPDVLAKVSALPQARAEITLMTHFAQADEIGEHTRQQIDLFDAHHWPACSAQSLANSAATLRFSDSRRDWVRPGGILYGLSTVPGKTGADLGFNPCMTLSTRLIAVKHIPAGAAVGYGGTFIAPTAMRIGIAAIGYGDGYPRHASSGAPVLIDGALAHIVGRVSMDLLTIDVSHLEHARVGSIVTLWGPNLPVESIAQCAGTISYELTCGVTRRVRFLEAEA